MSKKDGGPAFPVPDSMPGDGVGGNGMSIRDYIAIHAESGDLAVSEEMTQAQAADYIGVSRDEYNGRSHWDMVMSKARYEFADSMLKERDK